jgi:hypothetical protein
MRGAEREMQKPQWIEHRLWSLPEPFRYRALRDFRRAFALRVTTHAVADDQQCRIFGNCDADAILIGLAAASEA